MEILAHGLGGRSDLPIPLWMALYAGTAALLISFFALGAFWTKPRLKGGKGGSPLPMTLQRVIDSRVSRTAVRIVGVLFLLVILATALLGPDNSSFNPAPTWFYVWFWVGLVPVSILFGPVWRRMNPFRGLTAASSRLIYGDDEEDVKPWPPRLGYWPAALSLGAFVWLELVFDAADRPIVVALFIFIYGIVQIFGGMRYGQLWHDRGDGFEVYASLLARLSPFGRRDDGRLVLRNPFDGLAGPTQDARLVPVVAVILGSTAFDGLTRTQWWSHLSGQTSGVAYLLLGTAGLMGCIAVVLVTYRGATSFSERYLEEGDQRGMDASFIHSLIPIAIGYTIAHYFSLLVFQGQAGYILASDPLDKGWNLFGTADRRIDYRVVSTALIAYVQILSIVIGHVLGVVAAHDRAVELFTEDYKRRAQYSLLGVMVLYTTAGIALLVGT